MKKKIFKPKEFHERLCSDFNVHISEHKTLQSAVNDFVNVIEKQLWTYPTKREKIEFLSNRKSKLEMTQLFSDLKWGETSKSAGFNKYIKKYLEIEISKYHDSLMLDNISPLTKSQNNKTISLKSESFVLVKQTPSIIKELTKIMNALSGKYIHESTKLTNFRNVFSGAEIACPIIWIGDNADLYYMITILFPCFKTDNSSKWITTCNCFLDSNGERFDPLKLRQTKEKQISVKSKKDLNSICDSLREKILNKVSDAPI